MSCPPPPCLPPPHGSLPAPKTARNRAGGLRPRGRGGGSRAGPPAAFLLSLRGGFSVLPPRPCSRQTGANGEREGFLVLPG